MSTESTVRARSTPPWSTAGVYCVGAPDARRATSLCERVAYEQGYAHVRLPHSR